MKRLPMLVILPLLVIGACSSEKTTAPPPGAQREGLTFDDLAPGVFTTTVVDGYRLSHDDDDDTPQVVDLGGGARGLTDPATDNDLGAEIILTNTTQRLFTLDGLDAADLNGDGLPSAQSWLRVRGFRIGEPMGTEFHGPTSASFTTFASGVLTDVELDEIRIDIRSTGDDDYCVRFLELDPVATAFLHFDELPTGTFEHLFNGEFELTWAEEDDRPDVVDADDGDLAITDSDLENDGPAVFTVHHNDGTRFVLDAAYLDDLSDTSGAPHATSRVTILGFVDGTLAGTDDFDPAPGGSAAYETVDLAGVELTSLRIEVQGFTGTFETNDYAVTGLLVTVID